MSAWAELAIARLCEEIRHYPGPIARCDQHLAALLEERACLIAEMEQETCSAEALWTNDGGFNAA